ncbi:efflux transporter outer membrane subunit [Paludibacterium yongneupense]|uniref:efflux transporter outer membrane subunit n=1 Tax=Paludibacterium yongneupense TaxID=400061 RepID=UPI0004046A34|nr:efflux transporter outer membrane subunit [Paludibacterium yongneupense]
MTTGFLAVGGCAQIPDLGALPTVNPVANLDSAKSFDAPAGVWPGDGWWRAYADAQLDALIAEALNGSPTLKVAEARFHQAGGMVQSAGATRLPEVSGNAALDETKQSYNYLMPQGDFPGAVPKNWHDYGQATLNMSWELDFWGKNRSALAAATSEQQASLVETAEARLLLSTSIASAYAELSHLYTVRDADAEALALRSKTAALFRQRYVNGMETMASVNRVEARQDEAEANLHASDERIALQKNALAALLGAGPDRGLAIKRPTAHIPVSTGLPPRLASDLLGRRPDVVAARLRTEAAARRIDQAKAGFYPSVNLIGMLGMQSLGIHNLGKSGSDIGDAGVGLSLPIFNTERLQGQLRGVHAEYEMSVANYDATLSNALHEVADAATSRKALGAELRATRSSVIAARKAYDIVNQRYRGQLASYLDVTTAEDELVSAKRAQADVEARAMSLDVALVRALGGGFQSHEGTSPAGR